ncbi:hypothetical protein [Streptosporangium sp. V21-05]|uniref:hypothetical protein n=1 Tax=Streptosporangium sp. V21-05 TaxID=3446115 RepID=UPI003F52EFAB
MTPEQRTRAIVHNAADRALSASGHWIPLTGRIAITETVLAALTEHGLAVAPQCGCGQPAGVCELCGGPRCWRCNPWFEPPRVPCGGCPVCAGRVVGGDGECYAASWRCDPTRHTPRAVVSVSPPNPNPGHPQHPTNPATGATGARNHNSEETT